MTGACVQTIVFGIILSASVGIHGADDSFCNAVKGESPHIKMCIEGSQEGTIDQSVYLDSTGAPEKQKVECNCTLELKKTAAIELTYRVDANKTGCNVAYMFDGSSTTWGCNNISNAFHTVLSSGTNITYIKNDKEIRDWYSCTKLKPLVGNSIKVTCFPFRIYYAPEDDVDGVWGAWSTMTECSATCGGGSQTRTRDCNDPKPQNNGTLCSKTDGTTGMYETEFNTCNTTPCSGPVNGQYSEWNTWSDCTLTCNGGTQSRNRNCNNPLPQNGGKNCTEPSSETQSCNTQYCPADGRYSEWGTWSYCTQTCGSGTRTRLRTCDNPEPLNNGKPCTGDASQNQTCMTQTCPVDGQYANWSAWSICSKTCEGGTQSRSRACDNPAPQNGGQLCVGEASQNQTCNMQACPVDGAWSPWSTWTTCSETCGHGGYKTRSRVCNNPEPDNGGNVCWGAHSEQGSCDFIHCPINGSWSVWENWSPCSMTCGQGIKLRKRSCTNPSPQYDGTYCSGENAENAICTVAACAVHGEWGHWSNFGACSVTCGNGNMRRYRSCNSPYPSNGGSNCMGDHEDMSACYQNPCSVNGEWGPWSPWSTCSATCDDGVVTRNRLCDNPPPSNGGSNCSGSNKQSVSCNTTACPVNAQWGPWSPWSICGVSCGESTVHRQRFCNNPPPSQNGNTCNGDAEEQTGCSKNKMCPVDGGFGPWSPWSTCSVTCNAGEKSRRRVCDNPVPAYGGQLCTDDLNETTDCYIKCTGSSGMTTNTPRTTKESMGDGNEVTGAQREKEPPARNMFALIGGIIGALLFALLVLLLLICFLRRRRKDPKTDSQSVRYMSGDDVTVTENELYNYDGENPAHAMNALFVGGIPETPSSPGYIPHFSTDTGDRYAVIMDSNRTKPKVKERPSLQTFQPQEKDNNTSNGDIRAPTDTVKLDESYNQDLPGTGVENPGYDEAYLAPYESQNGKTPKTESLSSSPYDYIDHEKLKKDDEAFEGEQAVNDYATQPDERDDTESEYHGRYKRFINKNREDEGSDGYLKSPKRDTTFEYPDLN